MSLTTDPNSECLKKGQKEEGQNTCYLVLSDEERAKGFVRPVRKSYVHTGKKVEREGTIQPIEEHESERGELDKYYNRQTGYVAFLKYGEDKFPVIGKYITQKELDAINSNESHSGGCGARTVMNEVIAETYARNPKFYGSTFCIGCNRHLPVEEFVWDGTNEIVGS